MRMRAGLYTYLAVAVRPCRAPNPKAIAHLPWCRGYLDIPKSIDVFTVCAGIWTIPNLPNFQAFSQRVRRQIQALSEAFRCSPFLLVDLRVPVWARKALAKPIVGLTPR